MFASEWNQRPFSKLTDAVRSGNHAFTQSMESELFEYLNDNPKEGMLFNRVMGEFLAPVHQAVSSAVDFSIYDRIVDVGGGRGSLLAQIVRKHPQVSGTVVDLPSVSIEANQWLAEQGLSERIESIPGDFFESVPSNGDLYLLCRVIHDWDDEDAIRILKTIRHSMKPGAKLYLIEQIMPPGNDPSFIKTTDLWMMLIFNEGRERTKQEITDILEAAGFRLSNIINTKVNDVIIEAIQQ
jgi:hypothetical protein